jgi:hypothetical protein
VVNVEKVVVASEGGQISEQMFYAEYVDDVIVALEKLWYRVNGGKHVQTRYDYGGPTSRAMLETLVWLTNV